MISIKSEYFKNEKQWCPKYTQLASVPHLYPQERDWTCSVACLRSIVSGEYDISEDSIVDSCPIEMGPQTSKAVRHWMPYATSRFLFGAYQPLPEKDTLRALVELMKTHTVMIECMINYEHWVVLLGFTYLGSLENSMFILYDPYLNTVRTVMAEELLNEWFYVTTDGPDHDYVAFER